jgi:hypothetical protein
MEDYILMRRMHFKNWKIVDVDHYMKGNSFFKTIQQDSKFFDDLDHYLGDPATRSMDEKDEAGLKEAEKDINGWLKFLAKKEPRSNRGLD